MMRLEKTEKINSLLDAYETLLTDKQREIASYYYKEDFSLSEIAEILHISRAAVSDHLKRTTAILYGFEENLKLVEKLSKRMAIYGKIKKLEDPRLSVYLKQLEDIE